MTNFAHRWAFALPLFGLSAVLFHLPTVARGLVPAEDDVDTFYFPLLVATVEALREGTVRLWTPAIFTGFPLFAESEAGMLYPIHLLTLPWMAPETAFTWLRVAHSFLAAAFTYYLLHTLGAGPLGRIVGALSYAFSGFAAAQIVHTNVFQSMAWLPLELALAERMGRSVGLGRYRYAALGGAAFGIQALGSHLHVTLMSGLVVTAFCAYRLITGSWRMPSPLRRKGEGGGASPTLANRPPGSFSTTGNTPHPSLPSALRSPRRFAAADRKGGGGPLGHAARLIGQSLSRWERGLAFEGLRVPGSWLVGRGAGLLVIGPPFVLLGLLGMGLAAAQLLPLYELAGETYRSSGLPSQLATVNSVWRGDLFTLFLPHLHWTDTGGFWGPWVSWETVLYVGILPLLLSVVGFLAGAGPYRPFFGGLAIAAVLLALGPHAPLPLWETLRELPGFSALRSPGRFALVLSLAVAVGAAYGVDWLARRAPSPRAGAAILLAGALAVLATGLGLELASMTLRSWIGSGSWLIERYLALPGIPETVDGAPLTVPRTIRLTADALAVSNPATAWQLALALGSMVVLALWFLGRPARPIVAVATVALTFCDLWVFGLRVHPYTPIASLRPQVPEALLGPAQELFRVFTPPNARDKESEVDPNRLMIAGIQEAGGYSSLQPDRHFAYVQAVRYADNHLLDLLNVRYLVRWNRPESLPSYQGVTFHPQRPLFNGKQETPGAGGALLPEGPARTHEVGVVAGLWDAKAVPDGSPVARVTLESPEGARRTMHLRAGRDVSDTAMNVPGATPGVQHQQATVAFTYQRAPGENYGEHLYYAGLPVVPPMTVSKVLVEHGGGPYGLRIYGVGLRDPATGEVTQARHKEKLRLVHADPKVLIYENQEAMPRAFVVGSAVNAPPGRDVLSFMIDGPFDPSQVVILEDPTGEETGTFERPDAPLGPAGMADIKQYKPEQVVIEVTADRDGFLVVSDSYDPGWVAEVDGQETPVLRGDYLFRAVPVPAGNHRVVFSYRPLSVALGALISLLSAAIVIVVAAGSALAGLRKRISASQLRH